MDIDKRIATEVMGWDYIPHEGYKTDYAGMMPYVTEFNPSTNISDAWLVVERMRELGWIVTIGNEPPDYDCEFIYDRTTSAFICEETAPLAICNAALAALSEKNK